MDKLPTLVFVLGLIVVCVLLLFEMIALGGIPKKGTMDEINWIFLEQVKRNTFNNKGSMVPLGMFVDYQNRGLLEGTSGSARITQHAIKLIDEAAKPAKPVKPVKAKPTWRKH